MGNTKTKRLNLALTEEAFSFLRDAAAAKGISMTAVLEQMIRENCNPEQLARDRFGDAILKRFDEARGTSGP